MTITRNLIFLIVAIVCFILAAVASQQADEIIFNAVTWLGLGLASFAAAHLP